MKTNSKVKIILLCIFVPVLLVFAIRAINEIRYPSTDYYDSSVNITDMEAYPTEYDGLSITKISKNSVNGFRIIPNQKLHKGVIVTFGGSEGGCNYFSGINLAKEGYEVVSLFFFGQSRQPDKLNKIPLEFFGEFLTYAKENNIDTSTLTLLGGSKGAELALLLTNYYDEIDNLIIYSPSSYVFQGLDFNDVGSSWTYNGQELPYISFYDADISATIGMFSAMTFNYPVSYRKQYETSIKNTPNAENAKINVSKFGGNILIFAGDDDAMWHSSTMAQEIYELTPENTQIVIYENTGHIFEPVIYANGLSVGGTKENNQKAKTDSNTKMLEFLNANHK